MNTHNWFLYLHGDPTGDMALSGVEYRFIKGDKNARRYSEQRDQFLVFVPNVWYDSFIDDMMPDGVFDDGSIEAHLNGHDVVINMIDIFEMYDVEWRKLLTEEERREYEIDDNE